MGTSADKQAIEAATMEASTRREMFSSSEVLRQRIVNGTMLQWSNSSFRVLYRVEFEDGDVSSRVAGEPSCVIAEFKVPAAENYMFFAEHGADEVTVRLLDNTNWQAIEPVKCVTGCNELVQLRKQSWGAPIGASLLISITSLLGVLVLSFDKRRVASFVEYMASFAAGCLIGVVVFHLYPEGSEYVGDLGEWVMGACVLGGIALSMAIEQGVHIVLSAFGADPCATHGHSHSDTQDHSHGHGHSHGVAPPQPNGDVVALPDLQAQAVVPAVPNADPHCNRDEVEISIDGPHAESVQPIPNAAIVASLPTSTTTLYGKYIASLKTVQPIAWISAVGDFFHAFTDGVVLAVAFKSCSSSLGWAVMLGIVLHEVPHRVGDFFIFLKAGMLVAQALAVNFVASLASFLGVIILLGAGAVSDHTLGLLLAFGSGALLFIAMSELLPPMLAVRDRKRALLHFVWFALGGVLIGLSKRQDVHCDAATGTEIAH